MDLETWKIYQQFLGKAWVFPILSSSQPPVIPAPEKSYTSGLLTHLHTHTHTSRTWQSSAESPTWPFARCIKPFYICTGVFKNYFKCMSNLPECMYFIMSMLGAHRCLWTTLCVLEINLDKEPVFLTTNTNTSLQFHTPIVSTDVKWS